ncbi:SDR family oxidoreductase [Novosphingobium resinovorum]|uniref:SDR family oxidoreductase n=1 Tax=Novosphingobium TaxID=165696 RepID=UPI001B3C4F77|nr:MULTISPECIES: SDR family oxidoreductase [Novosphingobium]MBF7010004.1 SDR family oxidoreductase [Novosphingobium sp. HR1a]WJM28027.1 SDR family oxidoreductase [Novosphingobium resinovorum]
MTLAIVTGAGQGLGRAVALELVARGCIVAGLARSESDLAATSKLCATAGAFHPIACDVSDYDALRGAFDAIRRIGPIAILINNAAVYPRRDFLDETPESFMHTMAINLGGMVACSRLALEDMVSRGSGRIVNVTSFADLAPIPASGAYSVSKGAGRIFTRALVADLEGRFPDIVISDWIPGALRTAMGLPDGIHPADAARWGAELALSSDPSLNGTLWERNNEVLEPQSLKRRVFNRLMLRPAPTPRMLCAA